MRDDATAQWIKRRRDEHSKTSPAWIAVDDLLDDYRWHADTGQPLTEDAPEGSR
jgi:hypothetical protein